MILALIDYNLIHNQITQSMHDITTEQYKYLYYAIDSVSDCHVLTLLL